MAVPDGPRNDVSARVPDALGEYGRSKDDEVPQAIVLCACWQTPGHMLWLPGMRSFDGPSPWGVGPYKYLDHNALHPGTNKTGDAQVSHKAGWTTLGIEDRTGDSRPNSHSTFAMKGIFDFGEALALAQAHFPEVIARIEAVAPITEHIGGGS